MRPKQPSYFVLSVLLSNTLACLQDSQPRVTALDIQDQVHVRRAPLSSTKTIIQKVRVFDGQGFTSPQSVVFADGHITADTGNIETVIDGTGQFLIPGLIDAHVHITDLVGLANITSYGVTTTLNMACRDYTACAALRNNNQTDLASFLSAGIAAVGNGSGNGALQPPPDQLVYPDSNLPQLVAWAFGNGSDYYKLTAKPASLTQTQQDTIVSAAHDTFGRQTMTHATDLVSLEQAVASKSDGLQHIPDDGLLPCGTIAAIKRNKQFVTPTMTVFKYGYSNPAVFAFLGRTNSTNATYAHVEENVRRLHEAGVPILAGTDAVGPVAPGLDLPFGSTLHEELQLLKGVGLTPLEALRAGTVESAVWHRLFDRGEIKVGKRADLVLLNSNPLLNISNTRDIAKVWVGGVEVQDVVKLT
jgi:imidazolonepropionase-like amidohydrolase